MRVARFARPTPRGERKPYTRRESVRRPQTTRRGTSSRQSPRAAPRKSPRPGETTRRVRPAAKRRPARRQTARKARRPLPRKAPRFGFCPGLGLRPTKPPPRHNPDFAPPSPARQDRWVCPARMDVYGWTSRSWMGVCPGEPPRRCGCTPRGAPISGGASLETAAQSRENFREIRGWGYRHDG
jgi:hypothetical protein